MFTGIIQEIGRIERVNRVGGGVQLTIHATRSANELIVDHSVSVNGVCQTVIGRHGECFDVVAVEETLLKTTLGNLGVEDRVNLELATRLGDRLGGHLVSGHVDCVGEIESVQHRETSWMVRIVFPAKFERYVIPVGSIAIDGVSLTVASVERNRVIVSVIPHTMENTIFSLYKSGSLVNIEFDMIGKYIEKLMGIQTMTSDEKSISPDELKNWGYGK